MDLNQISHERVKAQTSHITHLLRVAMERDGRSYDWNNWKRENKKKWVLPPDEPKMIRLEVNKRHWDPLWWQNGGHDMWLDITLGKGGDSIVISPEKANRFHNRAAQLPGWRVRCGKGSDGPILFKNVSANAFK